MKSIKIERKKKIRFSGKFDQLISLYYRTIGVERARKVVLDADGSSNMFEQCVYSESSRGVWCVHVV